MGVESPVTQGDTKKELEKPREDLLAPSMGLHLGHLRRMDKFSLGNTRIELQIYYTGCQV
ncbi:rCG61088 [Rattus norvegicus]|uniref:RCG61088 n=1 Tax=Rattus norvegicus TaxID=10116 RepID=A6JKV3_RAT|nr:rCG61088 [Rattus norvegicus]